MDDSILDVDQVENLIKFCPTKEEMELLKVNLQITMISFEFFHVQEYSDFLLTLETECQYKMFNHD